MPKVYEWLHPSDMDAENPVNYHVIEAWHNTKENTIHFPDDFNVLDGKFLVRADAISSSHKSCRIMMM